MSSSGFIPTRPETLRRDLEGLPGAADRQIVIDEIQRVPELLSEVHWLIENRGLKFALCGSSARRLRRRGVHLLGGRAVRYELRGLTAAELGPDFDLTQLLNSGVFPFHMRVGGSSSDDQRLCLRISAARNCR